MNTKMICIVGLSAFMLTGLKPAGAETPPVPGRKECINKCQEEFDICMGPTSKYSKECGDTLHTCLGKCPK